MDPVTISEEDLQLLEETTIDSTPLPSFFELTCFVDSTSSSLQRFLRSFLESTAVFLSSSFSSSHRSRRGSQLSSNIRDFFAQILIALGRKYEAESRFIITWAIESWSLHSSAGGSSFAESFYNLRRCRVEPLSTDSKDDPSSFRLQPLTSHDKRRAAIILSFFPYLKEKLDKWYEQRRAKNQEILTVSDTSTSIQQTHFLKRGQEKVSTYVYSIYPFLHMVHDGIHLAYRFAYLMGRSVYACPYSHCIRQVVRRAIKDEDNTTTNTQTPAATPILGVLLLPPQPPPKARKLLSLLFRLSLAYGFTSYLSAIIQQEIRKLRRQQLAKESSSPIPPPLTPKLQQNASSVVSSLDKTLCPLCYNKRLHPVAASSGYVFCFRCLIMYIRNQQPRCPLTGIDCSETDIIRLYEPTTTTTTTANR